MTPPTPISPFSEPLATPLYPEVSLYNTMLQHPMPWEFNGWKPESLSWKNGCYIHAGLSGPMQFTFRGPEAEQFLSRLCINGFSTFQDGSSKHAIMLADDGLVATHGLLQRDDAECFRLFAAPMWPNYHAATTELDVELSIDEIYIFQISGPTALQVLERVTGENLRDIEFLRFRPTRVAGFDSEICRIGMSGTLAFELRGPYEQGAQVYDAVYQAGEGLGLERLGAATYTVNHVEGGFPQVGWTFMPAALTDPGFGEFIAKATEGLRFNISMAGSVDPTDLRSRMRTPVEVGWQQAARFDHDFIGREALEQEMAEPKRTIVTLRWDSDDVLDVYGSLFRPGDDYKTFQLPATQGQGVTAHADHVLKDGEPVGISSGTTYSYHYREMISHCTIDLAEAEIGNEVVVQWGDHGGAIKDIRATVERYPYLELERNQTYDLDAAARGLEDLS